MTQQSPTAHHRRGAPRPARLALAIGGLVLAGLLLAAPAGAHVTVNPSEATQGGFATLTFRVPNERDDAATVSVQVVFPAAEPVASLRVRPVPGWTATVETRTAAGEESVASVTWSGGRIEPGEFQEFAVSGGPLPETDQLVLQALQTYDDGEVVRWIETTSAGGAEPDHPAPVLTLVAGSGDGHDDHGAGGDDEAGDTDEATGDEADGSDDGDAAVGGEEGGGDDGDGLAVAALVVGSAGLAAGVAGIVLGRRRA
ncbi:MAG: YcnI family protein [Acidimicrobiia bacterium]